MPLNLELKARVRSFSRALKLADEHARFRGVLVQRDTYFVAERGRLKLREAAGGSAELICYIRNDAKGKRWSTYEVCPIPNPSKTRKILSSSLGILVEVKKRRRFYMYGNARIHLDVVWGLGPFIEFEIEAIRGRGQALMLLRKLVSLFEIRPGDLVGGSYSDLVRSRQALQTRRQAHS